MNVIKHLLRYFSLDQSDDIANPWLKNVKIINLIGSEVGPPVFGAIGLW